MSLTEPDAGSDLANARTYGESKKMEAGKLREPSSLYRMEMVI